jgi:phospholipid/cholesterol/gamma-HCH transport system permease protein
MGPVVTGLVLCGRVGSESAVELGWMKVTAQTDAIDASAANPYKLLALANG